MAGIMLGILSDGKVSINGKCVYQLARQRFNSSTFPSRKISSIG
jgi:hypothetical protein